MDGLLIRPAMPADAPFIAQVVCLAIASEEGLIGYCGENYVELITFLAAMSGTQYSWKNAMIAELDGKPAGGIVAYNGALLYPLRNKTWDIIESRTGKRPNMDDETQMGEWYLDSLAVLPSYRNRGIAKALIKALMDKVAEQGVEYVGLLVDFHNGAAQSLYADMGFKWVNESNFLGHTMFHLQRKIKNKQKKTY